MSVEDIKRWSQWQTLTRGSRLNAVFYSGYDIVVPPDEFPLDVRYADFKRRLNELMR